MITATILLNIDLAAGTAALVAIAMVALPNIDRIRAFRRLLTRRPVLHARLNQAGRHSRPASKWMSAPLDSALNCAPHEHITCQ